MPPYIKEQVGRRPTPWGAPRRRSPPPSRSRTPPFLLLLGGGRKGERGEGKGGAAPLLIQFGPEGEGARGPPWPPLSLSTKAHVAHYLSPGGSGNPPALRFSPKTSGTPLVSEYSRPIYQSLCLDHFETPHYVRDHIWDSEQTSVHQNL